MKESKVMKKRTSKIVSILLAFALIVSAGDVVRAEDVDEQRTQTQEMAEPQEPEAETTTEPESEPKEEEPDITVAPPEEEPAESEAPGAEEKKEEDVKAEDEVQDEVKETVEAAPEIEIGAEEAEDISEPTESLETKEMSQREDGKYYASKLVSFPAKGVVAITATCTAGNFNFGVFTDPKSMTRASTLSYDAPGYVSASTRTATKVFNIPAGRGYYIGIYTTQQNTTYNLSYTYYNGSDRAIGNNQPIAVGQRDAQTNYFSFKAPYTGYLRVQGDTTARNHKVILCDASKRAVSGASYLGNDPTYGVAKGKTYYIRVDARFNSKGAYVLNAANSKISEKSGKTKKKAVTIKKKKTKSGIIESGKNSKQADWYKFKLTSKKKVNITVTTGSNESLKITLYKGGKRIKTVTARGNSTGYIKSIGKWKKGTYYIKVQRGTSTSSGYYTLKWK